MLADRGFRIAGSTESVNSNVLSAKYGYKAPYIIFKHFWSIYMQSRNYTYILECSDGKLYTGWTNCIERRLSEHNSGKGARFTRGRRPVKLRYLEISQTKSDAMKREAAIKKLTHAEKKQLILQADLKKILTENHIHI